jgi:hypothetical protein
MIETVYSKWKIIKWPTAMSAFSSPRLESLSDGMQLQIIVNNPAYGDHQPRMEFIFSGIYAYRNINRSYRNSLFKAIPTAGMGNTWMVQNSDFLDLLKEDAQGALTFKDARHFVILTENDVIEVVSAAPPRMRLLKADDVSDEESQVVPG